MTDRVSVSKSFFKKSIGYSFLYIYLGLIMLVMSHQIHIGQRAGEVIAYFMSGATLGAGFTMIGSGILGIFPFLPNRKLTSERNESG